MRRLEIQKDGRDKWYARFRAEGSHDAILQSYSFYNHGATNVPEPDWRSDVEFVFVTSEAKLFRYFVNSTFWQLSVTKGSLVVGLQSQEKYLLRRCPT
jgi:hypothetical protein